MEYNVGDLVESISVSHKFPDSEIIFLNTSDILNGDVLHHELSKVYNLPGQAKKSIQKNDILYSEIRPKNKRFAYVDFEPENYVVSTKLMVLRVKDCDILLPKFLYYFLSNQKIIDYLQNIAESRSGTFPQITFSELKPMKLTLPTIKQQLKIVKFIDAINKKIRINQDTIANLEELSQTIFKRWFVDFEFPNEDGNSYKSSGGILSNTALGEIPTNWDIYTINDFADKKIITGKTPSTKVKENYSETGIPFLTIPDMHNTVFSIKTERYISKVGIESLYNKVLPKNSLAISCIATPGLVNITSQDTLTNQQINSFTPYFSALYYLYFKLKSMKDYIKDLGSGGSATLNLNKTQFSKIKLIKPSDELLFKFNEIVHSHFEMILNTQQENTKLVNLRDSLLPKLMSGEIELPENLEV